MSLVSTKWLFENKERVKIIDSSWHLPSENRNSEDEYNAEHIDGAIYFDMMKILIKIQVYNHMLPNKIQWEKIMSKLGISNRDIIVVYDNSDVICSLDFGLHYNILVTVKI